MNTQKIQITLTPQEIAALSYKSKSLGYNVTKYIKFLVMKEAHSVVEHTPEFAMTAQMERKTLKALKEHRQGKSKRIQRIEDLSLL